MTTYRKAAGKVYLTKSGKGVTWRRIPDKRLSAWIQNHWKPMAFIGACAGGYGLMLLYSMFEQWVYLTYIA